MKLLLGDCLEKLKELEADSVDSIVTDPPYGLEFMGKEWDSFKTGRIAKYKEGGSLDVDAIQSRSGKGGAGPSYTKRAAKRCRNCGKQEWSGSPCKCDNPDFEIDNSTQLTFQQFNEEWARECYRVLKPGGHLLAFAGSRMYHRLAVGVEDAGFEIRDQIMWIYGSGFPKSHNIGKAVDKIGGSSIGWFGEWLKEWREENNIAQSQVAKLFPSKTGGLTGCVSNWELGKNIPTLEEYNKIVEEFDLPFKSLEELEREVIGKKNSACFGKEERHTIGSSTSVEVEITKGNSDWEGWGTALKPAHEPIVMARKPFKGNVANNVLEWGTGGINIDGCRVGNERVSTHSNGSGNTGDKGIYSSFGNQQGSEEREGRFPANIIFECTCDTTHTKPAPKSGHWPKGKTKGFGEFGGGESSYEGVGPKEEGDMVIHTDPNCPCYILDQQSGNKKSSKRGAHNNKKTEYTNTYTPPNAMYSDDNTYGDEGGASRFFYCPKASKKDRDEGLTTEAKSIKGRDEGQDKMAVAYKARPTERQNIHPTVKPTDLMGYLIRLVTPKGGIVLDPFMGSGSTGKAAVLEGMDFIGIEREEEYYEIAKQRIEFETNKRKFW